MARLRTRYLSCFYCGRKQSAPYDGKTRQFDCPSCEATNYLDHNGDITDPPVATDKEATPAKYAVSRAMSPPSSPTGAIFCDKCIRNQHLLRASLAQYLPDPDDPEYEKLEKDYYRFRNNQEKQYPQICAECEPKVRQRLEQAAYTAKTDVLRRMIERSSTARKQVKGRSWLDFFDMAGRWLWVGALFLQLGWHVTLLEMLYAESSGGSPLLRFLLEPERLMRWSIWLTILGSWWNPHFPQVVRGFTKHINGVPSWYLYQIITVTVRVLLPKSESLTFPDPKLFNMQLAGHAFTAAFTLLIVLLSRRAIRIDMAPLFQPTKQPLLSHQSPRPNTPKPDEKKSLSELLDEISTSPPDPLRPPSPVIPDGDNLFMPRAPQPNLARTALQNTRRDSVDLNGLNLNAPPVQYPEEMEWSPTVSRHRAFNAFTEPSKQQQQQQRTNAFWAKIPPAPVPPAHLAFKPIGGQSRERKVSGPKAFGFGQQQKEQQPRIQQQQQSQEAEEPSRGWEFRQPKFFPPGGETDPRNSLSDMFGQSFSLSQEEREREEREKRGWFGFLSGGGSKKD